MKEAKSKYERNTQYCLASMSFPYLIKLEIIASVRNKKCDGVEKSRKDVVKSYVALIAYDVSLQGN